MRILILAKFYHPFIGGVETTVKMLAEEFVRSGHQTTVLCTDRELRGEETVNDVRVVRVPLDSKLLAGLNRPFWRFLAKNVSRGDFDIIHINSYHALISAEGAMFMRLRGIPYIFSAHYHGRGHTPIRNLALRSYRPVGGLALQGAERVISVSEYEKALLTDHFPELRGRISVIPSGIKEFPPLEVRRRPDRVLYVGRLISYKGIDKLIMAVDELRRRGSRYELHVIGDGPQRDALQLLIQRLHLEDRVTLLGDVSEDRINWEYREAGLLGLLSGAEAYGLVVAEALSCGTPCLIAKKEALVEFLGEPGVFGVDYPADPRTVADSIESITGRLGEMRVGPFSDKIAPWSVIARRYLQEYERCIELRSQKTK